MTENCHTVIKKVERWLALSDTQKDAVKTHAKGCPDCMRALASIEPVLHALDLSARAYHQTTYTGLLPPQPDQKPAWVKWWFSLPRAGWATALTLLIGIGVWLGLKSPPTIEVAERPKGLEVLRIPSMPSLGQGAISIPMSPGALGGSISKPDYPSGPSLKRHIQAPQKPETPNRDSQKRTSMRQHDHG